MLESRGRGVLDRPVEPGDDSFGWARSIVFSRQESSESCISFRPPEQRAQGKPGADRTHGPRAKGRKLGGRTTGVTGAVRLSLRDGFTAYFVLSPARLGLLVTAFAKRAFAFARGHRPPGRQDQTTSPSASCALVSRAISVHRIPHRVRDDREAPLDRVRRAELDHRVARRRKRRFARRVDLSQGPDLDRSCSGAVPGTQQDARATPLSLPRPDFGRSRSRLSAQPPAVRRDERRHGHGSRCCASWLTRGSRALRDRRQV